MKILFQPDGITIEAKAGDSLLDAARAAGVFINSPCGGKGSCGKCRVRIVSGRARVAPGRSLDPAEAARGVVAACRAFPEEDLEVEVPESSRAVSGQIAAGARSDPVAEGIRENARLAFSETHPVFSQSPICTVVRCKVPPPDRMDAISDADRIKRCLTQKYRLGRVMGGIEILRKTPAILRKSGFDVTVMIGKRGEASAEVLDLWPADPSPVNFGAALDIGTTTLALHVLDLVSGETVGAAGALNSQARFGEDVITRILHAGSPGGLEDLRSSIVADVNRLLRSACAQGGIEPGRVTCMQVAANSTMTQLLLAVDPTYIRKEPYVATSNFYPQVKAADLAVEMHPSGMMSCAPGVASYVGGDVVAGVVACGMARSSPVTLLIDLGTNGEMALGNSDWMACASCSVGPAFEGSGIRCGMRAADGAIQEVQLSKKGEEAAFSTLGDAPPIGICGTGLIDLVAEMLDAGVIDRSARLQEGAAPSRISRGPEGLEYLVAKGPEGPVGLAQADLDNLLRSKAAVFAAAALLVRKMGLSFDDVDRFIVAGGFGSFLDFEKAVRIGLLPDQPREKFAFVGNTSLEGAKLLLRFEKAREEARRIAEGMAYIELSGDNSYHEEFMSALFLPHTDLLLFPSSARPR